MSRFDHRLNEIDFERVRRARELSAAKEYFKRFGDNGYDIGAKSIVLFCYANWEAFFNFAIRKYLDCLRESDIRVIDHNWDMMLGVLENDFKSLVDRSNSRAAQIDFIRRARELIDAKFDKFVERCVLARSNLNFEKLRENFEILGISDEDFLRFRLKIDRELVGWRHSIAHGEAPDLSRVEVDLHVALTDELMLMISDKIQELIVELS